MAEHIDRNKLGIGKCNPDVFENKGYAEGWNSAIDIIMKAPTEDVAPVKHARWINDYCSNCGADIPTDSARDYIADCDCKYCYYCGAKMDGDEDV